MFLISNLDVIEIRCCDALQCCIWRFGSSAAVPMLSFISAKISSDPTATQATISTPNASAITWCCLAPWPGERNEPIKRSELVFP
jgi:hypothetical protein